MGKSISGIWSGKMEYSKEKYKKEFEKPLKLKADTKFFIKKSTTTFKINKFIKKGNDSLDLAKFIKDSNEKAKDYWDAHL